MILTAFQPFGGRAQNSAEEALRRAAPELGRGVVTLSVPVIWGSDIRAVWPAVEPARPPAILMLGQGPGGAIRLETTARNRRWAGETRDPERAILLGAAPRYLTTAPVEALRSRLEAAGLPAVRSDDAGSYLCNHLYYHLLHRLQRRGWRVPALFVHLPLLPAQVAASDSDRPSLGVDQTARAVVLLVQGLLAAGEASLFKVLP